MIGVDTDLRVTLWNSKAEAVTGYAKADVEGRDIIETLIRPENRSAVKEVLQATLRGTETNNYEFPLFTKDGEKLDFLLNATTRWDVKRECIVGVIGVGQDVTPFRNAMH